MSSISTMRGMRPLAVAGLASAASALCVALCPGTALAYSDVAWSYDGNGQIKATYASIDEALQAGYSGEEIWMSRDWELSEPLTIEADKSITINMNGRIIKSNVTSSAVVVSEGAHLTLTANNNGNLAYKGYARVSGTRDWTLTDMNIESGGLVTNNAGCGIGVRFTGKLTLSNVTVAGNSKGGISTGASCVVTMKKHASVQNNSYGSGGGVRLGSQSELNMDNSSITQNFAKYAGAGVYISSSAASSTIDLENNSKIADNMASAGGGVYLGGDQGLLVSKDKTGTVSGNTAFSVKSRIDGSVSTENGGGICVGKRGEGYTHTTIRGVTVANNYSALNAGGIEVNQENTLIDDCALTGNVAAKEGGGVYINNKNCTVKNCTLTGNTCNDIGKSYEGGGVFAPGDFDVTLSGKCVIKGNTRGANGSADDLFLASRLSGMKKAYILGGVSEDSKVGVRTDTTGNRKIAKDLSSNAYGAFFMDLASYYVSYEHDTYGNMWQDEGTLAFAANLNGKTIARYNQGTTVTIDGCSKDANRVFWYWDAEKSTGMYPVSEYINGKNKYNPLLTLSMPQNDVNAVPVYATRVGEAHFTVDSPVAGDELSTESTFWRRDMGTGIKPDTKLSPRVTWYEVKADGTRIAAAGKAKAGTTYVASVTVAQDNELGLFFKDSITAKDIELTTGSGLYYTPGKPASASVDKATGALTIESPELKTEGTAPDEETGGKVTVTLENGGLQALAGGSKQTLVADADVLDTVDFHYSEDSDSITITAPKMGGMNFAYWDGVKDAWASDDAEGTVTIPASDLEDGLELIAVYTPVVTGLEVGLAAPAAGGKLAARATSLVARTSDGQTVDIMESLGKKNLSVVWSSEGKSAACSTAYSSVIALDDDGEGYEGLGDVLAQDATVTFAGGEEATSAGFAVVGGKLCLCVVAPKTAKVAAVSGLKAAKAGKGAVKVSWKKASRSGVQLRYSTAKSMKGAKKAVAKGKAAKSKKIKKLKSGKKYYFQARAYKVVNGKRYYSAWSVKKNVKVK